MSKNKKCKQNEIDTPAEAIVEIVKINPKIGIILATGFAAGFLFVAVLGLIYGINFVNDKKPARADYSAPVFDLPPN